MLLINLEKPLKNLGIIVDMGVQVVAILLKFKLVLDTSRNQKRNPYVKVSGQGHLVPG